VRTLLKRHGLLAVGSIDADADAEAEAEADAADGDAPGDGAVPAAAGGRFSLSAV
jgi:hypothetical protein